MQEINFQTVVPVEALGVGDMEGWEVVHSSVEIKWAVWIEIRQWGVKSLTPIVPPQKVRFQVSRDDEVRWVSCELNLRSEVESGGMPIEPLMAYFNFGSDQVDGHVVFQGP
jgi:hypothetical protein